MKLKLLAFLKDSLNQRTPRTYSVKGQNEFAVALKESVARPPDGAPSKQGLLSKPPVEMPAVSFAPRYSDTHAQTHDKFKLAKESTPPSKAESRKNHSPISVSANTPLVTPVTIVSPNMIAPPISDPMALVRVVPSRPAAVSGEKVTTTSVRESAVPGRTDQANEPTQASTIQSGNRSVAVRPRSVDARNTQLHTVGDMASASRPVEFVQRPQMGINSLTVTSSNGSEAPFAIRKSGNPPTLLQTYQTYTMKSHEGAQQSRSAHNFSADFGERPVSAQRTNTDASQQVKQPIARFASETQKAEVLQPARYEEFKPPQVSTNRSDFERTAQKTVATSQPRVQHSRNSQIKGSTTTLQRVAKEVLPTATTSRGPELPRHPENPPKTETRDERPRNVTTDVRSKANLPPTLDRFPSATIERSKEPIRRVKTTGAGKSIRSEQPPHQADEARKPSVDVHQLPARIIGKRSEKQDTQTTPVSTAAQVGNADVPAARTTMQSIGSRQERKIDETPEAAKPSHIERIVERPSARSEKSATNEIPADRSKWAPARAAFKALKNDASAAAPRETSADSLPKQVVKALVKPLSQEANAAPTTTSDPVLLQSKSAKQVEAAERAHIMTTERKAVPAPRRSTNEPETKRKDSNETISPATRANLKTLEHSPLFVEPSAANGRQSEGVRELPSVLQFTPLSSQAEIAARVAEKHFNLFEVQRSGVENKESVSREYAAAKISDSSQEAAKSGQDAGEQRGVKLDYPRTVARALPLPESAATAQLVRTMMPDTGTAQNMPATARLMGNAAGERTSTGKLETSHSSARVESTSQAAAESRLTDTRPSTQQDQQGTEERDSNRGSRQAFAIEVQQATPLTAAKIEHTPSRVQSDALKAALQQALELSRKRLVEPDELRLSMPMGELGMLDIDVAREAEKYTIRIAADSSTIAILDDQRMQLAYWLRDQGFNVDRIEFNARPSDSKQDYSASWQQANERRDQDKPSRSSKSSGMSDMLSSTDDGQMKPMYSGARVWTA